MAVGGDPAQLVPHRHDGGPLRLAVVLRRRLIPEEGPMSRSDDGGTVGPAGGGGPAGCHGHRDVLRRGLHVPALHLFQAAVPELEVQNFGMLTQNQLELRRVLFGITPEDQSLRKGQALHLYRPASEPVEVESAEYPLRGLSHLGHRFRPADSGGDRRGPAPDAHLFFPAGAHSKKMSGRAIFRERI